MDNSYENIVPWNGEKDTGRDVRLKLERNFKRIGGNFTELNGKIITVDELIALLADEIEKKLSKTEDDKADGVINFLKGLISEAHSVFNDGITTNFLQSSQFTPGTLGAGYQIKHDPLTGKSYIEVDELYVRLKAVFDSLAIKEAYHVGGEQIQTLASIKCTQVESIFREALFDSEHKRLRDSEGKYLFALLSEPVYRCYFVNDDGEKAIVNQFVIGDFAQCRQFDIKDGVYEGVSNRYYWRYVVGIGDNYIDLSVADCEEGSDIPAAGDTIIQLGNRTDVDRQNAIIFSAYGENAPCKQMLQGINSYSLLDKIILEEGFDKLTNQAYTKTFGHSYVGSRDESSYMRFTPEKGVDVKGNVNITSGTINLKVDDNNSWEVDENCINTIGDKSGERIELNPSSKNIRIFNEDGNNTAILDGKTYNSVKELFPNEIPDITISHEIPINIVADMGEEWEYTLKLTDPFYTSYDANIACPHTGYVNIQDGYSGYDYAKFSITIKTYSDEELTNLIDSSILHDYNVKTNGRTVFNSLNKTILVPVGFHQVEFYYHLRCSSAFKTILHITTFSAEIMMDAYLSKYFGNGLILGTEAKNLISMMSNSNENGIKYVSLLARNLLYGIEFDYSGVYSYRKGKKGMIPGVICSGMVHMTSTSVELLHFNSFDDTEPPVHRAGTGCCQINIPDKWRLLGVNADTVYVILTGIGHSAGTEASSYSADSAIKATFGGWQASDYSFTVLLSDDATANDGDFFFEVKWY